MAKIELSICENYVPDWGVWQGIREIYQNCIDEHEDGHEMRIEHDGEWLRFRNDGSALTTSALLIGYTTKAGDNRKRGEKGEGLKLGLLALVRNGFKVAIRTQEESWVPTIEHSDTWNANVLFIRTRKASKREYTEVAINIPAEEWENRKERFITHAGIKDSEVIKCQLGEVILDEKFKGMLFVKGIWVQTVPKFKFGYNIYNASLDRDRNVVNSFDLDWAIGSLWSEAVEREPEKFGETAYQMLIDDEKDANGFSYHEYKFEKIVGDVWEARHGKEALPVASMGEAGAAKLVNRKPVIVSQRARQIIEKRTGSIDDFKRTSANLVEEVYQMDDLSDEENAVLEKACKRIDSALSNFVNNPALCKQTSSQPLLKEPYEEVMNLVTIVRFNNEKTQGLFSSRTCEIRLCRDALSNYIFCLKVLVHEMAHRISDEVDGDNLHTCVMEDIWSAIECDQAGRE